MKSSPSCNQVETPRGFTDSLKNVTLMTDCGAVPLQPLSPVTH